jgi:hypothetical protein
MKRAAQARSPQADARDFGGGGEAIIGFLSGNQTSMADDGAGRGYSIGSGVVYGHGRLRGMGQCRLPFAAQMASDLRYGS